MSQNQKVSYNVVTEKDRQQKTKTTQYQLILIKSAKCKYNKHGIIRLSIYCRFSCLYRYPPPLKAPVMKPGLSPFYEVKNPLTVGIFIKTYLPHSNNSIILCMFCLIGFMVKSEKVYIFKYIGKRTFPC